MRIAVLQPSYLPWLGYLDQIRQTDAFVFYDDVQYDKNGWRNRNRIRVQNEQGWAWLTIPVRQEQSRQLLNEVVVDSRVPWRSKHLRTIALAYAKRHPFDVIERHFTSLFEGDEERLVDIAITSVKSLCNALGLSPVFYRSSELGIGGDRNGRLVNICRELGATEYLSGEAAKSYLDETLFAAAGVEVLWQNFEHPVYQQCYEPFISHLSAVDAVINAPGIGTQLPVGAP